MTKKFKIENLRLPLFYFNAVRGALLIAISTVIFLTAFSVLLTSFSSPALAQPEGHNKFLGTGSCSSSNCHGSMSPRNSNEVLQNEYSTWQKKDKHAQAWTVLTNEQGQKIGRELGIAHPEKDPICLKCHATYVANAAQQGEKYRVEDGVTCESCHGAAEKWIDSHTGSRASHENNLSNGMTDIVDSGKRATMCIGCHYGSEDAFVTHRIMGSGHPRLTFELDTFGMIQPKHWEVDEDYKKRKGDYEPARAWLIGQTKMATRVMETLVSDKHSRDGAWPELVLFNCYTCHHSLSEAQWKSRDYKGRPGELRLNLSSLIILVRGLSVLDNGLAKKLEGEIENISDLFHKGDHKEKATALKALLNGPILEKVSKAQLSNATLKQLLVELSTFGAETPNLYYETAEQVAMGISAVTSQLSPKGDLHQSEIAQLYKSLGNPEDFKCEGFTSACQDLARAM